MRSLHETRLFINDNKGNGKINLKANYHFRTAKPDSFDSLFKRYPAGTGKLKDTKEIFLHAFFSTREPERLFVCRHRFYRYPNKEALGNLY